VIKAFRIRFQSEWAAASPVTIQAFGPGFFHLIRRGVRTCFFENRTTREEMNLEGDLVLVHYQDEPAFYARIEKIEPDIKKDWFRVTLLLLTLPPRTVTWILREEYINGAPFTMAGKSMRLEKVKRTVAPPEPKREDRIPAETGKPARVIPFKKKG
jgi:hypothetical protein